MTRILLYLLALVGGFSAAEAARPVTAQPAELGAPAALAAAAAANYAATVQALVVSQPTPSLPSAASSPLPLPAISYRAATVSRSDRARE